MVEYNVPYKGIIYIIPNDELYQKYKNGEAFIDKYGRLIDSKSKRIIKELEHKGDQRPVIQRKVVMIQPPQEHPIRDAAKQAAADVAYNYVHRAVDWTFDVGIPRLWHEHIVPFFHRTKEALTSKELKADAVLAKSKASTDIAVKQPKTGTKMTQEEADTEKRKVLYHWLELLESLTKLQSAGELDATSTLAQITDSAILEQVNHYLGENPNLLETDRYLRLHHLLGRDLYEEGQLLPIDAAEIKGVAVSHGLATECEIMEVKHNG